MKQCNLIIVLIVFWSALCVKSESKIYISESKLNELTTHGVSLKNIVDLLDSNPINERCRSQLNITKHNPSGIYLTMHDAWSRFPYSGMWYARRLDLGTYDECMSIDYTHIDNQRVLGKHCAAGLLIPTTLNQSEIVETGFKLSICIPDACSAADLTNLTGLPLFNDVYCTTKEDNKQMDTGAIITLIIYAIIFGLMVISTIYDVYLYWKKRKHMYPLYTAFSVFTNGRKLFQTSKGSKEQILCFHGIKFISMWWIMAGHGGAAWLNAPIINAKHADDWLSSRYSQYLATAHLAVDSFFFISGFLIAYVYFKKEVDKPIGKQLISVPHIILHRYLRLTPALLMIYLYTTFLSRFVGNGPVFSHTQTTFIQPCKEHWWAVFLYIQNYYNAKDLCQISLWYLSADMQLFVVSIPAAIILALFYKGHFKLSLTSVGMLNLVFVVIPVFTKLHFRDYDPNFDYEYDSHSRLIDYFIGFMFGMYVRHERHKFRKINTKLNLFLWILALAEMYAIIAVTQEINLNHGYNAKALCYSFTRPFWCLGLCWIVFSCINGQGGIANWFLSCGFMQIGGKLTYCLYLVHGNVIAMYFLTIRNKVYFSDFHLFYAFCGHFIVSMLVAIIWTLAFESPLITIERVLLGGSNRPAPKRKHSNMADVTPPPVNVSSFKS